MLTLTGKPNVSFGLYFLILHWYKKMVYMDCYFEYNRSKNDEIRNKYL